MLRCERQLADWRPVDLVETTNRWNVIEFKALRVRKAGASRTKSKSRGTCVVTETSLREKFAVGAEGPVLTHQLVHADLIRYAGASGDFHPLHNDNAFAKSAGFDGVFAHGMYSAGLLATAVTNWLGAGKLLSYRVRFAAKAWPGEVLNSELKVTGSYVEGDFERLEFSCNLVSDSGEVKIIGSGTAAVNVNTAQSLTTERTQGQ